MEDQNESDEKLQTLIEVDDVVHSPVRLAVLTFLISKDYATFPFIRNALGLTGGNLSAHLTKLAKAELIDMKKMFVDLKPTTIVSITDKGRDSLTDYASNLSSILTQILKDPTKLT